MEPPLLSEVVGSTLRLLRSAGTTCPLAAPGQLTRGWRDGPRKPEDRRKIAHVRRETQARAEMEGPLLEQRELFGCHPPESNRFNSDPQIAK